ncbi:MAG: hypothetical protein FD126_1271 [Elusimicrobia bacterium]|nr:MAG: hypothetical protein FD126_1271 [Elusimicrobiota bacterium]
MFFSDTFRALDKAEVRYLVVGGVAVVLHGFVRATADLDLIVDFEPTNLSRFLGLMKSRGYLPKPPVPLEAFADPENRRVWREEKGMKVFTVHHPERVGELVDIFSWEPFPFGEAYVRRLVVPMDGYSISVAAIADLIALKRPAGRPQDLEDIKAMEARLRAGS